MISESFPTETIVLTHQAALRSHCITEVCALTTAGRLYIQKPQDIRYNPELQTGEVCVWGEWYQLTPQGIALWATRERLNWLMPDGRVLHPDEPLYPTDGLRPPVLPDVP